MAPMTAEDKGTKTAKILNSSPAHNSGSVVIGQELPVNVNEAERNQLQVRAGRPVRQD